MFYHKSAKEIREETLRLYEQSEPQKTWFKAMYEKSSSFRNAIDSIGKALSKDRDVICCVRQDAYNFYKLAHECLWQGNMQIERHKIIPVEHLTKNSESQGFAGKRALIVDFTLSNGYKMFECYCLLKKLGFAQVRVVEYALSTEWKRESICEKMYQIYYESFGITEITERAKLEADAFYREWINEVYCYQYFNQENISKAQLQLLLLFHRNCYLSFEKLNSDERYIFETIRWMVMCSISDGKKGTSFRELKDRLSKKCFISQKLLERQTDVVLQVMQELSIIEIKSSIVQWGKNADWLLQGEGKLCCLCVDALYITLGKQEFILRRKDFLQEAKKDCNEICQQNGYPFNGEIFDYYIDWYLRMNEGDLEYYVLGQRLWPRAMVMTPLENEIHDAMKKKVDCPLPFPSELPLID